MIRTRGHAGKRDALRLEVVALRQRDSQLLNAGVRFDKSRCNAQRHLIRVVDAVDQRRKLLMPAVVGREQIRLMLAGGNKVEQHDSEGDLIERGMQRREFVLGGGVGAVSFGFPPFTRTLCLWKQAD